MIIRLGGGSGGLKAYLEHGAKVGRELHRDQLDQRIPLFGDLNAFELITSMQDGDGQKYGHITLSFDEHHITDDLLQIAVDRFRDHALAAYPENERDGILMYAEAHRPRVLSYTHSQNNKDIQRFAHIHIGIGKKNLETGRYVDPLGYLGEESDNQKYLDAFQESFNAEFGLSSPKDKPRVEPETAIDIYARYTGEKPDALGSFVARKSDFEINLQKQIIDRNITSWADFGKLLGENGIASKMKEGKFGECWKIKLPGEEKSMRLKGVFFQQQFIERPTAEKVSIIMDKAKTAYLEKMQPRKEPEYIAGVLNEWRNVKSKEIKYKSSLNNKAYKEASAEQRIEIIKQIESKNHGIKSPAAVKSRKTAPARNRVPGMPVRNLDGISKRAKMLLSSDSGVDVRAGASAESISPELRQAARGNRGREAEQAAETETRAADTSRVKASAGGIVVSRGIIQPSSVLAQIQHEQRERYEQAADKERYAEIRQNLDCTQLLNALSHSNGINTEIYKIIKSQDGSPRIQCGTRALTPNDFLTKELGLAWKDAAQILRKTYEQQIGKQTTKPRQKSEKSGLWDEFNAEKTAGKPALAERLKEFDDQTKIGRTELFAALKIQEKEAMEGLRGSSRSTAKSLSKFNAVTAKAEFSEQRRELRKSIKPIEWKVFLQTRAQAGSAEALEALRKMDDTARAAPVAAVMGTICLNEKEKERRRGRKSFSVILKHLEPVVQINGDITFSKNGVVILRDEGEKVSVIDDRDGDSIAAALLLAREKFGPTLMLNGSPEFQKLAVEIAVAQGIPINFADPLLESERVRLTAEKNQPRAPAAPTPEPASAPAPAPAPAPELAAPAQAALVADQQRDAERAAAEAARAAAQEHAERFEEISDDEIQRLRAEQRRAAQPAPAPEAQQPNALDEEIQQSKEVPAQPTEQNEHLQCLTDDQREAIALTAALIERAARGDLEAIEQLPEQLDELDEHVYDARPGSGPPRREYDPRAAIAAAAEKRQDEARREVNRQAVARGITHAVPYPPGTTGLFTAEHFSSFETARKKAERDLEYKRMHTQRPERGFFGGGEKQAAWDADHAQLIADVKTAAEAIEWRDAAIKTVTKSLETRDSTQIAEHAQLINDLNAKDALAQQQRVQRHTVLTAERERLNAQVKQQLPEVAAAHARGRGTGLGG